MRAFIWCFLALAACTDGNGNNNNNNDDTGGDDTGNNGDTDTDVNNNWTGQDNGVDVPSRSPDQVITGNLADGEVLSSLSWMEQSPWYCAAAPGESFSGAHAFETWEEGPSTDLYVRLTPDAGLDMSLYLLQRTDGSTALPPSSESAPGGGGDCDSSYEADGNPGQPEAMCVYTIAGYDYSVLIGIAGADGLTSGSYQIEIWENDTSGGGGGCIYPNGN